MRGFERRHSGITVWGFLTRSALVLLLFVILIFAVRSAWGMYQRFANASEGHEAATRELEALKEREGEVKASVANLSSERGVEAEIRERYGVGKPGEGKIEIVRDPDSDTANGAGQSGNIFIRIFRSLFVW